MNDRYFLDTNVVLYAFDKNADKKRVALRLLKNNPVISLQVLNEAANILLKKFNLAKNVVTDFLTILYTNCEVCFFSFDDIITAVEFREKYKFSYYDSLILATAKSANCSIIYTEDLNDGQMVENTLQIVNPFR